MTGFVLGLEYKMTRNSEDISPAALLWTKRGWMACFAACLMAAFLFRPFNWIWLASAAVLLILALHAHERLKAVKGEPCRWRDVFDLEIRPTAWLAAWLKKQTSNEGEGK